MIYSCTVRYSLHSLQSLLSCQSLSIQRRFHINIYCCNVECRTRRTTQCWLPDEYYVQLYTVLCILSVISVYVPHMRIAHTTRLGVLYSPSHTTWRIKYYCLEKPFAAKLLAMPLACTQYSTVYTYTPAISSKHSDQNLPTLVSRSMKTVARKPMCSII